MLDTPGRGYRAVGPAEGIAPSRRTGGTCGLVQCASLSLLILSGVAMLVTRPQSWPALPGYSPHGGNATLMHRGKRYGKRRAFMSLGRMGTSSSFVNNFMLRSRRPKKFKAQKVAAAQSAAAPAPPHRLRTASTLSPRMHRQRPRPSRSCWSGPTSSSATRCSTNPNP